MSAPTPLLLARTLKQQQHTSIRPRAILMPTAVLLAIRTPSSSLILLSPSITTRLVEQVPIVNPIPHMPHIHRSHHLDTSACDGTPVQCSFSLLTFASKQ